MSDEKVVPIESAAPRNLRGGDSVAHEVPVVARPGSGEPRTEGTPSAAGSFGPTYNVVPFNRVHRMQTRRVGLDEAMESHPSAGGILADKCELDCSECSDRRL